jgi:hypothetical protein
LHAINHSLANKKTRRNVIQYTLVSAKNVCAQSAQERSYAGPVFGFLHLTLRNNHFRNAVPQVAVDIIAAILIMSTSMVLDFILLVVQ